ncbi:hypothetical protein [Saccharothrix syringae]|uniref:PE-PGRS family protein n=1 Tax=Saccharothrix syringae TaxID=103733 RepID=A0A5Q0GSM9_SACSY|nr:hypothetical protein [Saccharothrix syringae]QFZ16988.1 hypothetical protein EKG83_05470 [Saccharothrix syringae]
MNQRKPTEPLVTRVDVKFGEMVFRNRPAPSDDRATVWLDRYGHYHHLTEQVPVGGVAGYRALFLVDTSVHIRELQFQLPSREQAFFFQAKVSARWRVTDPVEAAKTHLTDADPVLRPHLERVLRDVSAAFPIEEGTAAERAIAAAFAPRRKQSVAQGLSVLECDATLSLDSATAGYIRKRVEKARTHEITKEDLARAGVEQSARQHLDALRDEHKIQLERMRQQHELEMRHMRVRFYNSAMAEDPNNVLAMLLADDPGRANEVMAMLLKQKQVQWDGAQGLLGTMLEHGLVNRSDVAGIIDNATSVITDSMAEAPVRLTPAPASLPLPGNRTDEPLTAEVVADAPARPLDPLRFDEEFDEDDEDDWQ